MMQRTEVFKRQAFDGGANAASLREFVEIQNRLSKRFISEFQVQDPDFYSAIVELAMNAQRMIEKGKLFVNGQDRSSEGT